MLGDDELSSIVEWITDPDDRKSFSQVYKQWHRTEGLTRSTRSTIRVFEVDSLFHLLPRFPNLLTFETSDYITDTQLDFLSQTCPRIEVVNLNLKIPRDRYEQTIFVDLNGESLCTLAKGCPKLARLSLRRRNIITGLVKLVNSAVNLTHLDLGGCSDAVSDKTLKAIGWASSIRVLNLQACWLITDQGLSFLANNKTIKKLVLAECDRITDVGVLVLRQMCYLEELNLCDCGPNVTDIGGVAVAAIHTLKEVDLSWLINVSDKTIVALAEKCVDLEVLNLTGCELVSGTGIRAFSTYNVLICALVLVLVILM